jgi:hypothetical protein
MWLRDFLPEPRPILFPGLGRVRTMTFGYSSLVRDSENAAGLHEWSSQLLQSVSSARRSESVSSFMPYLLSVGLVQTPGTVSAHHLCLSLAWRNCGSSSTQFDLFS